MSRGEISLKTWPQLVYLMNERQRKDRYKDPDGLFAWLTRDKNADQIRNTGG